MKQTGYLWVVLLFFCTGAFAAGEFSSFGFREISGSYYLQWYNKNGYAYVYEYSNNAGTSYKSLGGIGYVNFSPNSTISIPLNLPDGRYHFRLRHVAPSSNGAWAYTVGDIGDVTITAENMFAPLGYMAAIDMWGNTVYVDPGLAGDAYFSNRSCDAAFHSEAINLFGIENISGRGEYCSPEDVPAMIFNALWLIKHAGGDNPLGALRDAYSFASPRINHLKPVTTYDCQHVWEINWFVDDDAWACNTENFDLDPLDDDTNTIRLYNEIFYGNESGIVRTILQRASTIIHEARHSDDEFWDTIDDFATDGDSAVHPGWEKRGPYAYQVMWLAWLAKAADPEFGPEIRIRAAQMANNYINSRGLKYANGMQIEPVTPNVTADHRAIGTERILNPTTERWERPRTENDTPTLTRTSNGATDTIEWNTWHGTSYWEYQSVSSTASYGQKITLSNISNVPKTTHYRVRACYQGMKICSPWSDGRARTAYKEWTIPNTVENVTQEYCYRTYYSSPGVLKWVSTNGSLGTCYLK